MTRKELSAKIKELTNELREKTGVADKVKNETYRKNTLRRIEEYRTRIKEGDFAKSMEE